MINSLKTAVVFCVVCSFFYVHISTAEGARLNRVVKGDEWHYLKGSSQPPRYWTHIDFDPVDWHRGPSSFGYGTRVTRTVLEDMKGNYKKIYVRRVFSIAEPRKVNRIVLSLVCDGPFIAYINGIEVIRNNKGVAAPLLLSEDPSPLQMDISGFAHELLRGVNVLSVKCENDQLNSNDFTFIPLLEVDEE